MSEPTSPSPARPKSSFSTIGGIMAIIFACGLILVFQRDPERMAALALGVLVPAGLLFPWIRAPLLMKRTHRTSPEASFEPFDPEADDLPPRVVESIRETVPALEAIGFETHGHFRMTRGVDSAIAFVSLFENRLTRRTARCVTVVIPNSPTHHRHGVTTLAFLTEFDDGTRLGTGNNVTPSLQPPLRIREGSMAFPWVRDPALLHEIHEASVAHYAGDAIRVDPAIADPVAFLRRFHQEETRKHAETGYYIFDEPGRVYRPTWKGAILMAWKLLPPVRTIRALLRHREARRILRELGLERLAAGSRAFDRASQIR